MVIVTYLLLYFKSVGWDSVVGLATGRFGNRIPEGSENFRTRPDRPWCPSILLYNG